MQKTDCSCTGAAGDEPGRRRPDETALAAKRPSQRCLHVVLDAREDDEGRALFAISALHLCADGMRDAVIRALCPTGAIVGVALEAFEWDTGVRVEVVEGDDVAAAFKGADLYVSASLASIRYEWL